MSIHAVVYTNVCECFFSCSYVLFLLLKVQWDKGWSSFPCSFLQCLESFMHLSAENIMIVLKQVKISEVSRTVFSFTYFALAPRCPLAWYLKSIITSSSAQFILFLFSLFYLSPIFFYISTCSLFCPS